MFLCDDCHEDKGTLCGGIGPRSVGPCEACKKTAACIDCWCWKNKDKKKDGG